MGNEDTVIISVVTDPQTKSQLESQAESEDRSVASLIRRIISEFFAREEKRATRK